MPIWRPVVNKKSPCHDLPDISEVLHYVSDDRSRSSCISLLITLLPNLTSFPLIYLGQPHIL